MTSGGHDLYDHVKPLKIMKFLMSVLCFFDFRKHVVTSIVLVQRVGFHLKCGILERNLP